MNNQKMEDFNEICTTYYDEIFHYTRKTIDSLEDAKDVTQDIFMRVYNKLHLYNSEKASIRTWLYKIAYSVIMNYFKSSYYKKKTYISDDYFASLTSNEDILKHCIEHESIQEVIGVMNEVLNKKHKKIMHYYFFTDFTNNEISQALHIPVKTIRNVINLSIHKIKVKLEELYHEL